MPIRCETDVQSYFGVLVEEYFENLDIEEKVQWISDNMTDKHSLRDWVENYVEEFTSINHHFQEAIMNTVDWSEFHIWAEEQLIEAIQDECDYCNKSYYTHLMIFRDCCKHFCVGCINKHDDQCIEYTEPENNKNKTLCLVCD